MKLETIIWIVIFYAYIGFLYMSKLEESDKKEYNNIIKLLRLIFWPAVLIYHITINKYKY